MAESENEPARVEPISFEAISVAEMPVEDPISEPSPSVSSRTQSMPGLRAVPTVGDRVGKYLVDRVIGTGGMGLVVAAHDEVTGDPVAIKLLRPKAALDPIHAERFAREARAIIRINSEHVVRVIDAGTLRGGAPYIVMEYLHGQDLAKIIRTDGVIDVTRSADLMLQMCAGVIGAHAVGVIHRDLKPSNFFVSQRPDGTPLVKVLDFGISKAIEPEGMVDPNLTETQAVFGSPTYMSPEQIRSSKHVDHRADVWSLGVVFYEMVTGKLPFSADNVAGLLASIIADPPFYPHAFAPDLPQAIEDLLLQCFAKDVRKRVQSVAELAARLAPFATPGPATDALLEQIGRIGQAVTTTGPQAEPEPPAIATTFSIEPSGPAQLPSDPPGFAHTRSSGIAIGSTGSDLGVPRPLRANPVAAIGAGLVFAVLLAGGGVFAYRLGARRAAPIAEPLPAATVPPAISAPSAVPVAVPVPSSEPSATLAPTPSAKPTVGAGAPSRRPPRHLPPKSTPPAASSSRPVQPVDPTNDRF